MDDRAHRATTAKHDYGDGDEGDESKGKSDHSQRHHGERSDSFERKAYHLRPRVMCRSPEPIVNIEVEKGAGDEVLHNRPMVGATGTQMREHCRRAGLDAGSGFGNCCRGEKGRLSKEVWLNQCCS
jgi:hypothetical protein